MRECKQDVGHLLRDLGDGKRVAEDSSGHDEREDDACRLARLQNDLRDIAPCQIPVCEKTDDERVERCYYGCLRRSDYATIDSEEEDNRCKKR